jgi:hypothetical protein
MGFLALQWRTTALTSACMKRHAGSANSIVNHIANVFDKAAHHCATKVFQRTCCSSELNPSHHGFTVGRVAHFSSIITKVGAPFLAFFARSGLQDSRRRKGLLLTRPAVGSSS